MNAMKRWMKAATTAEQAALATAAKTTRSYLYQLAAGARTATADLAGRIETAAGGLQRVSKSRLPDLHRTDLSPVCLQCPYARKCLNIGDTDNADE